MTAKNQLLAALPAANVRRFTVKRKAAIVDAVRFQAIDKAEACARYEITGEEFAAWEASLALAGMQALRVTRCQQYRPFI